MYQNNNKDNENEFYCKDRWRSTARYQGFEYNEGILALNIEQGEAALYFRANIHEVFSNHR